MQFGAGNTVRNYYWTDFIDMVAKKRAHSVQFESTDILYFIWFYDGTEVYTATIWKDVVPSSVIDVYSQEENDADKEDFETNYKDDWESCACCSSRQGVLLIGDTKSGVARVGVQLASAPEDSDEFTLGITSELNPGEAIETVSDPIPEGKTLHLLFARASCRPLEDANQVRNVLMVELIYREVWEGETYDHLFGKSFLDIDCSAEFPASSQCWDGTEMVGDGVNTVFVIRRTVYGNVNAQDTVVAVRGYLA